MLAQCSIRILSSQCCQNISETTLHKKTTCIMLVQSAQTCFCKKTSCSFKWLVVCFLSRYIITKQFWLFLFNVGLGVHLRLAGQMNRGQHWLEHVNHVGTTLDIEILFSQCCPNISETWAIPLKSGYAGLKKISVIDLIFIYIVPYAYQQSVLTKI